MRGLAILLLLTELQVSDALIAEVLPKVCCNNAFTFALQPYLSPPS